MGRPRTARAAKPKADASAAAWNGKGGTHHSSLAASSPSASPADLTILLSSLLPLLSSPTAFLSPSPGLRSSLLSQLQSLYGQQLSVSAATRLLPASALLSILPSLLTAGFTVDQIYEQWQLLQRPLTAHIKHAVAHILKQAAQRTDEHNDGRNEDEIEDEAVEGEQEEGGLDDGSMDAEEEEQEAGENEDEAAEAEDSIDDDDAEMEARLDAMQQNGEEDDDDEEEDDENDDEHDGEGEEQEQQDEESLQQSKPPSTNKRVKRTIPPSTAARQVGEDAFFSLDQMERFADHYEDIDTQPNDDDDQHPQSANDRDDGDEEWDDEVDLDADVGEVDLSTGERYDDFFDAPTEAELRGQSISDMHRQEDDEDGEGAGMGPGEEDEEGEGAEEGALEMDDEDGEAGVVEGDEFGGFFARLASHRRAQQKKAEQPLSASSAQSSADSSSTVAAAVPLSQFAQQQQALSSTLQQLEQQLITAKPWFHRGEVSAMERPTDSLLTTDLQVDSNVKQREVMTRAVNESIEELIRRRVSEGRYDDPVKRTSVKAKPFKVKESTDVSSEKSAMGLAQLYEQQYVEEKAREDAAAAADGTAAKQHKSKQQQERDKQVGEIRTLFASLVADLSALSQYSYVPAERSEVRIVRDKDERDVLAAEEIGIDFESGVREARSVSEVMRGKRAGEMVGEAERQQVERKRRRRQNKERGKKRKRDQAVDERHKQLSAGLNSIGTRKVLSQDELKKAVGAANVKKGTVSGATAGGGGTRGGFSKSGKFFSQLQQNVAAVEADARREGLLK